jgi:hypothetical protein
MHTPIREILFSKQKICTILSEVCSFVTPLSDSNMQASVNLSLANRLMMQ